MKFSEVTIDDLIKYCNAYDDESTKNDMKIILSGVKSYIKSYTGLNDDEVDEVEDLTLVLLAICADMLDNREFTIENNKVNSLYKSILDMHSMNYL
ncbi:MAG: head-tail connector protein [Clostridium sp.]|nr:head-tail connector protein [Clostridium sp.]